MGAIHFRTGGTSDRRLLPYAEFGRRAGQRYRTWLVATAEVGAVALVIGLIHVANGVLFRSPLPTDVATASENAVARVPVRNFAQGTNHRLAAHLAHARSALVAAPDRRLMFEDSVVAVRFGDVAAIAPASFAFAIVDPATTAGVSAPSGGTGDSAGASPGDVAGADPDPVPGNPPPQPGDPDTPTPDEQPPLLVYAPLTDAAEQVVANVVTPVAETAVNAVDQLTGPPIDLTRGLFDADAGSSSGGSSAPAGGGNSRASAASTASATSGSSGAGGSSPSLSQTVSPIAEAATGSVGSVVTSTTGTVGRLLR